MSAYALPDLFHTPTHFYFGHDTRGVEEAKKDEDVKAAAESVGIAVKEAKIDSAILIQSLVHQTNKNAAKKQSSRAVPSRKRRGTPGSCHCTVPPPSSQEALKFELYISFNGRKYTALRSLPSLTALRRDLLEEVVDADIPELTFEDQHVQGRSFSSLQGLLQSYVPKVHRWLRDVTQRVSPSASPSLRSFLWEPMSTPQYLHREDSSSASSSQLACIEEDETDSVHDDDDDHDDGDVAATADDEQNHDDDNHTNANDNDNNSTAL